ncbi:hypothetical protein Tco_1487759 [Tanacetum coccineum]
MCNDKIIRNTNHEDGDQEDGELLDFHTFSVTNVFASGCEQVDVNVNISIAKEKEEFLEEVRDILLNIMPDDEEADCNPTRDIEELERLLVNDTRSHFTKKKSAFSYGKDK